VFKKVLSIAMLPLLIGAAPAASADSGPGDPFAPQQWGLTRIRATEAWATATGAGVTIAVVDTGVDLSHPDLAANVDVDHDVDFVDGKTDIDGAQDTAGHGTHVAGIAAAVTNNGVGVAGVAPKARILPVRVLGPEDNRTARIAAGIRYAADQGAAVVNLSLSYDPAGHVDAIRGSMGPVHDAIAYALSKGAVVVASAGNDTLPLCAEPAAVNGVLCVGAVDRSDRPAYYTDGKCDEKVLTRNEYTIIEPKQRKQDTEGEQAAPADPPCSKATSAIVVEGPGKRGELVQV
jgi:subtilisin family serine protease